MIKMFIPNFWLYRTFGFLHCHLFKYCKKILGFKIYFGYLRVYFDFNFDYYYYFSFANRSLILFRVGMWIMVLFLKYWIVFTFLMDLRVFFIFFILIYLLYSSIIRRSPFIVLFLAIVIIVGCFIVFVGRGTRNYSGGLRLLLVWPAFFCRSIVSCLQILGLFFWIGLVVLLYQFTFSKVYLVYSHDNYYSYFNYYYYCLGNLFLFLYL